MRSALLFPLIAVLTAFASSTTAQGETRHLKRAVGSIVQCLTGTYQGKILSKVEQFLGVPFAQPPLGDLRYRRPQPLPLLQPGDAQYGQVINATAFQPRCIQATSKATSEDCLYLNVYRNQGTAATAKFPVMVYIFGGSFYSGGAASYSPSALIARSKDLERPVLFVTLDYRLGALGFGASPALREAGALNLGLHDQRQALRWIKQNIEFFGGDPEKIMLFGTSAGAISVSYQMLAYGGNVTELIRGAILESGAPGTPFAFDHTSSFPAYTYLSENEKNSRILSNTNCTGAADELSCLRQATVAQILAGQSSVRTAGGFPYAPVIDGEFLTDVPSKLLADGKFAQIPMIVGTQLDEGPEFVASKAFTSLNMTTDSQMVDWLMAQTPGMTQEQATTFLSMYPSQQEYGSPFNTGSQMFLWEQFKRASAIFGDLSFEAPRRAFLAAANALDTRNKANFVDVGALVTTSTSSASTATSTVIPVTTTSTLVAGETTTSSSSASSFPTISPSAVALQPIQTCSASADCTNAVPANANRYCNKGVCSFRCRTGYTLFDNLCINPAASISSTTSPPASSSTSTPPAPSSTTSTTSAAAATQTCSSSAECTNTVPTNSNRYCNKGVCSFRCRTGFALSDNICVNPALSTSSTSSPPVTSSKTTSRALSSTATTTSVTAAAQTCYASVECTNAVPANSNRYCNNGVCSFRCRTGFTLSGSSSCVANSRRRRRRALALSDDEITFIGDVSTAVVYSPLPVYSYQFSQRTGNVDYLGASHGDEIPWVFANGAVSNDDQLALRNAMSGYWIYFANHLDPNGPTSPISWPPYERSKLTQIQFKFGEQALIADTYRAESMSFINEHPEIFGQ